MEKEKESWFLIKLAFAYYSGSINSTQLIIKLKEFLKIIEKKPNLIEF